MTSNYIDLGFAEEQDSWLLTNRYFPSKIGGKTAWLELENIPGASDVSCEYCNEPCVFLCQIYAPSESNSNAFHRTIYVFICKNGSCCSLNQSGNIKVLRSQLPLVNKFYPDSPPDETIEQEEIEHLCKLCHVCGLKAPMVCGKCKKIHYCGAGHQRADWKNHKKNCCNPNVEQQDSSSNDILFPEYEIVIEREGEKDDESKNGKEDEARRMREYEEMVKKGTVSNQNDFSEKDLMELAESKEDKTFGKFKKTIEEYPNQVVRYSRHGKPLWIASNAISSRNVPNCINCNGKRTFEFQLMPQMLNELKNYDLDWGVIAVFTCEKDCDTNGKYVQEFCFKQDVEKGSEDPTNEVDMDELKVSDEKRSPKEKINNKPAKSTEKSSQKQKKSKNSETSNGQKKSFQENDNWE